jgi:hypothetical protein
MIGRSRSCVCAVAEKAWSVLVPDTADQGESGGVAELHHGQNVGVP